MHNKRYKAALIGLGRIADTIDDEVVGSGWLEPFSHMGSYSEVPEVEVVGAADKFPEQRKAFGERWGLSESKLYENYREMLIGAKPDIVSVCTHVGPRAEIALDIVEMVREGKTGVKCIWVEKPMTESLEEADKLVEACDEAGVILMLNAMRASDVYYRRARAMIDEGVLGKMLQITAHGSGPLAHMGVHWLGAMCVLAGGNERVSWLMGEVESDEKAAGEGDLAGNAYLAFENGARGFCRMLPSGASTWTLDAIGEKGTISIRNGNEGHEFELWTMGEVVEGARPTPVRHIFPRPQKIWSAGVGQVKDAIVCIETGKTPNCSGDMGRHLLEISLGIRESHRRGNVRVDLPLEDRSLAFRRPWNDTPSGVKNPDKPQPAHLLAQIARREGIGKRRPID
jgi:predicted dehydrogenase